MARLPDGTVIPSYMGVRDTAATRGAPGFFSEVAILVGEVQKVIARTDTDNSSGKFTEYLVNVWRRRADGPQERIVLRCAQSDSFGSVADWFRFSFRASTGAKDQQALGNGATVFVACVNGDRSNAYIIGAVPQPNRTEQDPASGRYLRSRFNGVEMRINDDGSFELMVPGPTDADGNPDGRDSNNHGSKLTFAKNGDIVIDDQAGESVKVSPGSKSIEVTASKLKEGVDTAEVKADSSWKLRAPKVVVVSDDISLGDEVLSPTLGAVHGEGVDPFSGMTYTALGNTSKTVKVKK